MKKLLTLTLLVFLVSFLSCKKEDDGSNNNEVNDTTSVTDNTGQPEEDTLQAYIDEKYAGVNWSELNLTDTCVMDICFECGEMDQANQELYAQLQEAYEDDCEKCLIQILDDLNETTIVSSPENENDTIQEIYDLFGDYYHGEFRRLDKDYLTFDFENKTFNISYNTSFNTEFEENYKSYNLKPEKIYPEVKLIDKHLLNEAKNCYLLSSAGIEDGIPSSLKEYQESKKTFLYDKISDYETCVFYPQSGITNCSTPFDEEIKTISFLTEEGEFTEALIGVSFKGNSIFYQLWIKKENGKWVHEPIT